MAALVLVFGLQLVLGSLVKGIEILEESEDGEVVREASPWSMIVRTKDVVAFDKF